MSGLENVITKLVLSLRGNPFTVPIRVYRSEISDDDGYDVGYWQSIIEHAPFVKYVGGHLFLFPPVR